MRRLLLLCGLFAAGCGLISSDITDFDLKFPKKDFTVDTAQWMLSSSVTMGGTFPSVPCPPADCASAASMFCNAGACTADCSTSATCTAHVGISIFQPFDLAHEESDLATINAQHGISVTVTAITFEISENTLNVATPQLEVFMAPMAVTSPTDPMAKQIGTILPIQPGFTGTGQVDISATGKATMEEFIGNYKTPFNIIVAGTADIHAGDPVPMGMMKGAVTVAAHAGVK
jgi:hypothetical protein